MVPLSCAGGFRDARVRADLECPREPNCQAKLGAALRTACCFLTSMFSLPSSALVALASLPALAAAADPIHVALGRLAPTQDRNLSYYVGVAERLKGKYGFIKPDSVKRAPAGAITITNQVRVDHHVWR